MVHSKSRVLARHPVGFPIPGEDLVVTTSEFDLGAPPPAGGLIIKTNYISSDPYQRGRMRAAGSGYIFGYTLDKPIDNNAISTVVASSNLRFKAGDVVIGIVQFRNIKLWRRPELTKKSGNMG